MVCNKKLAAEQNSLVGPLAGSANWKLTVSDRFELTRTSSTVGCGVALLGAIVLQ
jgi:hypothetical protein